MEEKQLEAIKLTIKDAEMILQYLSSQPYREVTQLVDIIQKSERVYKEEI